MLFWDACRREDVRYIHGAEQLPWIEWRDAPEKIEWASLSFYLEEESDLTSMDAASKMGWSEDETYRLICVSPRLSRDETARYERVGVFYLVNVKGELLHLNGSSRPIHAANEAIDLFLDQRNCFYYLGFFCSFVTVQDAPFCVSRTFSDLKPLATDLLTPAQVAPMSQLKKAAMETSYYRAFTTGSTQYADLDDEDEDYLMTALVTTRRNIHRAQFSVSPDGETQMLESDEVCNAEAGLTRFEIETLKPEYADGDTMAFGVLRLD